MDQNLVTNLQQQLKNHHVTIQQLNDKVDYLIQMVNIDNDEFNKKFADKINRIYNITGDVYIEEYNIEETK